MSNPSQRDEDGDGAGNICDPDNDNDGVLDVTDDCFGVANADQVNSDGTGNGDACDSNDAGVRNTTDNCRLYPNPASTTTTRTESAMAARDTPGSH